MMDRRELKILHDRFMSKELDKWYFIPQSPDYDKLIEGIKELIDEGHEFEFSSDYKRVRRFSRESIIYNNVNIPLCHKMSDEELNARGLRVEMIPRGFQETIIVAKGKKITVTHEADKFGNYKPSYRIYKGEQLIAIEV